MSDFAATDRLAAVELVEDRQRARTPEIQQELDVAVFDLVEENQFRIIPREGETIAPGPYRLGIGMAERMLRLEVRDPAGEVVAEIHLSLTPLRGVIKDYFAICESYFDAVKRLPPSRIEAIDMGRRGIHDEGARILSERLEGKVGTDHDTARRLFTVICALQFRG
ncbi:UPF0262 family protein [Limibaculum sp. M0105]|uniref:UPF0262 family protein n=1 Tax=Thermohalobaculum xanthum TaxID=2753746 RepID=A0A8J7M486_9RHOB|nr:UPF0262 family protein [Thermohalobaculum xanthum]MBK0398096.1 UPF0262 family protein [Thermohalobaculum xanthum]